MPLHVSIHDGISSWGFCLFLLLVSLYLHARTCVKKYKNTVTFSRFHFMYAFSHHNYILYYNLRFDLFVIHKFITSIAYNCEICRSL
jgi:hypothetical protein